jgi:hypothetical protein
MTTVSIIIPTYNRADMILTALESAQAQTYPDWEAIVVDDGSKDFTHDVVAGVKDKRVRYIYQANKGLPGARNTGIRASLGKYIAFLDSDDAFLPEKLNLQVPLLDAQPELGLVAGGYIEVDSTMQPLRELRPWEKNSTLDLPDWLRTCLFSVGSPLVRRTWLDRVGLFDESMRFVEDWDLWLRLSTAGCRMQWLREPVYLYRIHGSNMVRQAVLMKNGMLRMFDKFFALPDLPAEAVALRGEAYGHAYLNGAGRALAAGDGQEARQCLTAAFANDPGLLLGNPPAVIDRLASFALMPLVPDAEQFMALLADNLPAPLDEWPRRKVFATLYAVEAFEKARLNDSRAVVNSAIRAIRHDPGWLRNRGLLAITLRSLRPAR